MRIFYIEIDKFKKKYSKEFLFSYADKELKTEKRFYEYTIGRYLVKEVAKNFYKIKNTEIVINRLGKPIFSNVDLCFSISHSKNIVIACFDELPCGIDIEYMKERDLSKLSKHFNQNFCSKENFYKFWTLKEAEYKLGCTPNGFHSYAYNNYYISIASAANWNNDEKISPIELL